jgi:drug/metabolite transporter (DMT)-like permease
MPRPVAVLLLLICTMFWGFAFVAQKSAMDSMGALTFAASRYLLGGLLVLPFALIEYRRKAATAAAPLTRRDWALLAVLSVVFFLGSWLQQVGIAFTTVTNSGFLTSLYVLFVPLIAFVLVRSRPHPIIWIGAPLALIGIYYLNGGRLDGLNFGDTLVIGSSVLWGLHVFLLGSMAARIGMPVFISAVYFLAAGGMALGFAFVLETPTLGGLSAGWVEIAYAGVFSTAIAFTLQAIGQQHVPPANAAIILSAESLFAALGGAVIIGERLPLMGYAGAGLIFAAILLVEAVPAFARRRHAAVTGDG